MYSLQFSKNFPLPTYGGHFEFSPKMEKHKLALTVQNRVISLKFSTHRVSKECTLQFSKNFPLPTYGGHFEFSPKMEKHKLALTVQNRVISLKFSTHRVFKKCTLGNFQRNFPFPKNGGHFEFSNFCQN